MMKYRTIFYIIYQETIFDHKQTRNKRGFFFILNYEKRKSKNENLQN